MGVGVPVCLIYIGVHSLFRLVFGKGKGLLGADALFGIIATLLSFFFMVFYNNGQVRLHLALGEAIGFFVFMRVAGRHLYSLGCAVADFLHKIAVKLLYPFLRTGRAFVDIFRQLKNKNLFKIKKKETEEESFEKNDKKITINRKKFYFIGKILLKIRNKSV